MHLQIRVEHPRSLSVVPSGATVTSGGSNRISVANSSLSSIGSSLSPSLVYRFSQVQESVMVSPNNTSTPSSLQASTPSPSAQPPPAAPGTTSSPTPVTVTVIHSPSLNQAVNQTPYSAVTITAHAVSVSESVSIIKVVSILQTPLASQSKNSTQTVLSATTAILHAAVSSTSSQVSTGTGTGTSSGSLETASLTSSSAASFHGLDRHGTPFYIGIGILSIMSIAIASAFIAWLIRARTRRKESLNKMTWSWDPEKSAKGAIPLAGDSIPLRDLDSAQVVMSWNLSRERDAGEPRRNTSFGAPFPITDRSHSDQMGANSSHLFPPHLRTPFNNAQSSRISNMTTPEMMNHTLGPLTVANMMPGDVTMSGYEPSRRAHSSLGSDFGTPNEKMAGTIPRFMGLGGGLPVPWTPSSNPQHTRQSRTSVENVRKTFHSQRDVSEPANAPESWTSSLKSNFATVLNAMVGGTANKSRVEHQEDDLLTPVRPRSVRRLSDQQRPTRLSRRSTVSTIGYTLEETSDGKGIVHVHSLYGRPPLTVSSGSRPSRHFTAHSGLAIYEEPEPQESGSDFGSRASSVYSVTSRRSWSNIPSLPPRLPSFAPVRALTLRTKAGDGRDGIGDSRRTEGASQNPFSRPPDERQMTTRASVSSTLSRESTSATCSDLSRESSVMDEEEREARQVLRLRRKRAMALSRSGVGRGNPRRTSMRRYGSKIGTGAGLGSMTRASD